MQLGRTIIGVIIGGAVGIGAMFLASTHHGWDGYWMAIVVAICIGLAVRWLTASSGRASYFRGALTGLVSILAFIAGQYATAQLLTRGSEAKTIGADFPAVQAGTRVEGANPSAENSSATEDPADTNEASAAATGNDAANDAAGETIAAQPGAADEPAAPESAPQPETEEPAGDRAVPGVNVEPAALPGANNPAPRMPGSSTLDLVWLGIAALVGYSLGRGKERPDGGRAGSADDSSSFVPNRSMPPSD